MFRKRHTYLPLFFVMMFMTGLSVWLFYRAYRQERLDVAFIAAIHHKNSVEALSLLRHGADINTRQPLDVPTSPGEYLHALFDRLRGRPLSVKTTWSGLMLAVSQDDTALALTLLNRGAVGVNATAEWGAAGESNIGPDPLLVIAASRGDVALVQALLAHGAHREARGASGVTALLASSYELDRLSSEGYLRTAQTYQAYLERYRILLHLFLDHGADLRARSDSGQSVLFRAAIYGQPEEVALLLAHGVDPRDADSHLLANPTALHGAISQDRIDIVKMLLAHGARVDSKGDYALALTSDVTLSRLLLDHGADPNAHYDWNRENMQEDDETPLIRAARLNGLATVHLLLSRGAAVNESSTLEGRSALMMAARMGHTNIVRCLVEHGASVNAHDKQGETALEFAVEDKNAPMIALLKSRGGKK